MVKKPLERKPASSGFFLMTPTWGALMPVLVEVAVNGTSAQGRAEAAGQLSHVARLADRWAAWSREGA